MDEIEAAYKDALLGRPSIRPIIEMTIPSILDPSLVPAGSGHHIVQLFIQYTPYDIDPAVGKSRLALVNRWTWLREGACLLTVDRLLERPGVQAEVCGHMCGCG